jgi:hypothetical protein
MHDDSPLFDWTSDLSARTLTWLEVVASHARVLAAIEDTNVYSVSELRQIYATGEAD